MAERDRAPVGIDVRRIVGDAEQAQHRERLRRERLVQLDHVHLPYVESESREEFLARRGRADAHDAGRDAGGGSGDDARLWLQTVRLGRAFGRDQQRARAVVDAGGVAGGHGAVVPKRRRQLCERLEARIGADVLVAFDDERLPALLRNLDGDDLLREPPRRLRRRGALLAAQCEGVLIRARDRKLFGDVFGGVRHRVDAVLRLEKRVDEAPADRGVVDLRVTRKRRLRFAEHERCARHAFDAARDHEFGFAGLDGARGLGDRLHPRAAQPIDRNPRDALG